MKTLYLIGDSYVNQYLYSLKHEIKSFDKIYLILPTDKTVNLPTLAHDKGNKNFLWVAARDLDKNPVNFFSILKNLGFHNKRIHKKIIFLSSAILNITDFEQLSPELKDYFLLKKNFEKVILQNFSNSIIIRSGKILLSINSSKDLFSRFFKFLDNQELRFELKYDFLQSFVTGKDLLLKLNNNDFLFNKNGIHTLKTSLTTSTSNLFKEILKISQKDNKSISTRKPCISLFDREDICHEKIQEIYTIFTNT